MEKLSITVVGAGILGLWQAFELARRGHRVALREAMTQSDTGGASRIAGAMLAPYCEAEAAEPVVERLGLRGLDLWRAAYSGVVAAGSLVVAAPRDSGELRRFARMTRGHREIDGGELARLEPALAGRFPRALFFAEEAHLAPRPALAFLIGELRRMGVDLNFGAPVAGPVWMAASAGEVLIDCRGLAARDELTDLRGVRGEMAVLRAPEVTLGRPVRLLHPRFPLYVVPWGDRTYMCGATMLEREDAGPVTLRSALDLLGAAYAIDPGFAEAEILELSAAVRPAFRDNVPRIVMRGRRLYVNGAFRHGYLMAPALAELVARHLETGETDGEVFVAYRSER